MTVVQILCWSTVLGASLAWGQIYRWTDRQGAVHFTDDPSRIPPEQRPRATVYRPSPPAAPAPPATPGEDAAKALEAVSPPGRPQGPAQPRDRLGRGPEFWRAQARKWSDDLRRHLAERDRLRLLYDYTRSLANSTRDVWARGRLEAEIERLGQALAEVDRRIEQAQTMLQTTLPLEAAQLGADPAWLKEPTPPSP
jgi:hypothetical protein